jgi:hypothetical protein
MKMKANTKFALLLGSGTTLFLVAIMAMVFSYQVNKKERKYEKDFNLFSNSGKNMKGFNKVLEQRVKKVNKDSGGKQSNKHKEKTTVDPSKYRAY